MRWTWDGGGWTGRLTLEGELARVAAEDSASERSELRKDDAERRRSACLDERGKKQSRIPV
jgi:hypothetical protein